MHADGVALLRLARALHGFRDFGRDGVGGGEGGRCEGEEEREQEVGQVREGRETHAWLGGVCGEN